MGLTERAGEIREKAGGIARNYSRDAITTGFFVTSGYYLAEGQPIRAAASAILGATLIVQVHRNITGNVGNLVELSEWDSIRAHGKGVVEGRSRALHTIGELSKAQFNPEEPVYTPLDGSAPSNTPIELMTSLGGDVQSIATRIELILRHVKKKGWKTHNCRK